VDSQSQGPRLLFVPREDSELRRVVLQETRSLLLELLRKPRTDGKLGWSTQELARRLGCTTQNAHHHLKILEERGLAWVSFTEPTHGIPRQYWTTDIAHVYTDMAADAKAALAMDKARAHHAAPGADEAYFQRHFEALRLLGAPVAAPLQASAVDFYRRESALFARELARMEPRLREVAARCGVGEAKSALHFAAIAAFSEAEFEDWVQGLRGLRAAVQARRAQPLPEVAP
jgi:predicted transcriptional regulator